MSARSMCLGLLVGVVQGGGVQDLSDRVGTGADVVVDVVASGSLRHRGIVRCAVRVVDLLQLLPLGRDLVDEAVVEEEHRVIRGGHQQHVSAYPDVDPVMQLQFRL